MKPKKFIFNLFLKVFELKILKQRLQRTIAGYINIRALKLHQTGKTISMFDHCVNFVILFPKFYVVRINGVFQLTNAI